MDKPSSAKIEAKEDGRIVITPIRSEIYKYAGKYQKVHKKTKINIDKIRDHIDYSKT